MPSPKTPRSSNVDKVPEQRRRHRPSPMCQRLGTPNTPANPFHAGSHPDQLTVSAPVLDRYCSTLNFGHATSASPHSHNVPAPDLSNCKKCYSITSSARASNDEDQLSGQVG